MCEDGGLSFGIFIIPLLFIIAERMRVFSAAADEPSAPDPPARSALTSSGREGGPLLKFVSGI
jgi:hypothetical protein